MARTNLRRGSLATATKRLEKMSTALLPQTLATAIPDLGLKRENGEWVSTWELFIDLFLDLFTIPDASQKKDSRCIYNYYSPLAQVIDPGIYARGWALCFGLTQGSTIGNLLSFLFSFVSSLISRKSSARGTACL